MKLESTGASSLKLLVVGLNPADKETLGAVQNPTHRRLEKWISYLGVKWYSFLNTIPERGAHSMALVQWDLIRQSIEAGSPDKIIALGGFASQVLHKLGVKHFRLPHPSGQNRLLNDKSYEAEQLRLCSEYLRS